MRKPIHQLKPLVEEVVAVDTETSLSRTIAFGSTFHPRRLQDYLARSEQDGRLAWFCAAKLYELN
jgi:hypothetical protein